MAKIIEETLRARRRYPWGEWTDGQTRRIDQGEDYDVDTATMRVMLYQRAKKEGLKVTTSMRGRVSNPTGIVFRFRPKTDGGDAA